MSETLAAVIKEEPDWDALLQGTPDSLHVLLKRCLHKDPDRRLHDIADARIEMEESRSPAPAAKPRAIAEVALFPVGPVLIFIPRPAPQSGSAKAHGRVWEHRSVSLGAPASTTVLHLPKAFGAASMASGAAGAIRIHLLAPLRMRLRKDRT